MNRLMFTISHGYSVPSQIVCVNVSSSINCAEFSFCLSVGRTHLFCTTAMPEPRMIRLLKMETYG